MRKEESIQKIIERAVKKIKKLEESRDMRYTKETVYASPNCTLQIEVERNLYCTGCIEEEDGDAYFDDSVLDYCDICTSKNKNRGAVIGMEIYAVRNGEEIDCVTIHSDDVESEIEYLLKCYM